MLKKLFKDSFIYTIANLFSKGFSIIILPLYTRVLSQEDYGNLDLIFIFSTFILNIFSLQIMQAVARFTSDQKSKSDLRQLFSTAFWFLLIAYILFSVLFVFFKQQINSLIFKPGLADNIYYLFILYTFINGIWILLLEQFRWELKTKEYSLISFIYALLNCILGYSFAYVMGWGFAGILYSIILALGIASIISAILLRKNFSIYMDIDILKKMLYLSAPLIPAALIGIFSIYASRLSINYFLSTADLGLYSVALKIASISSFLLVGIQGSLTPLVYHQYQNTDTPRKIALLFHLFTAVCLLFCLLITLFSKELLIFFTSTAYISAYAWIGILSISLLLNQFYIFFPGIGISKQTKLQLKVSIVTFIVSIVSNIFLVYQYQIWGAVMSSLLSSMTFFILWARNSQKKYFLKILWKHIIFIFILYIVFFFYYIYDMKLFTHNDMISKSAIIILYVAALLLFMKRCLNQYKHYN